MVIALFSKIEIEIAKSILEGQPIPSCACHYGISKVKCLSIVNDYCSKSDHTLYEQLRYNPFDKLAPLKKLRKHAKEFISGAKRNEHVTLKSSIWALAGVPTMTLDSLWEYEVKTLEELIERNEKELLRYRKIGKVGVAKLKTALKYHGFMLGTSVKWN